jgi:hypothetical protein
MTALDFSDADQHERLVDDPFNGAINEAIDGAAAKPTREARGYLGASSAGSECPRRIQFDWLCRSTVDAQKARIFARGHAFEAMMREQMLQAGFAFSPDPEALAFVALDHLSGHVDGLIVGVPNALGARLWLPAIWECKAVKRDYWNRVARDGLAQTYPQYATQVALYQHFLERLNPALFTIVNADDCRALHFLVPYDEARAEAAVERVKLVIEATRTGELLERAYRNPNAWQCRRSCSHTARCWRSP